MNHSFLPVKTKAARRVASGLGSGIALLLVLCTGNLKAQTENPGHRPKLVLEQDSSGNRLLYAGADSMVAFRPKAAMVLIPSGQDMVMVDSQLVLISAARFDSLPAGGGFRSVEDQQKLLAAYVQWEQAYHVNEEGLVIINPQRLWVISQGRGWMIWYFRVGKVAVDVSQKAMIQLFASTVVGGSIVTLNAPVFAISGFSRIALTVNDMMEHMYILEGP